MINKRYKQFRSIPTKKETAYIAKTEELKRKTSELSKAIYEKTHFTTGTKKHRSTTKKGSAEGITFDRHKFKNIKEAKNYLRQKEALIKEREIIARNTAIKRLQKDEEKAALARLSKKYKKEVQEFRKLRRIDEKKGSKKLPRLSRKAGIKTLRQIINKYSGFDELFRRLQVAFSFPERDNIHPWEIYTDKIWQFNKASILTPEDIEAIEEALNEQYNEKDNSADGRGWDALFTQIKLIVEKYDSNFIVQNPSFTE